MRRNLDLQLSLRQKFLIAYLGEGYTENYIDKEPVIYRDLGDYDVEISGGHTKEQTISIFVWSKAPRQIVESHTRMPQHLKQIRMLLDDITTRYTNKEENDNEKDDVC